MSQKTIPTIDPNTYDGTDLATDLPLALSAIHSNHRGATRPAYAVAGMVWPKVVSASRTELMYFDGTNDVLMVAVNPTTGLLVDAGAFLRNADNLSAGKLPIARAPLASQADAEAGLASTGLMTPERVKQAIAALQSTAASTLGGQGGSFYQNAGNLNAGTFPIARAPIASQVEAEAGTVGTGLMTPLRVAQAIAALSAGGGWEKVDTVQPTIDTSTIELAGITGYKRIKGEVLLHTSSTGLIEIQCRASGGTWRTILKTALNSSANVGYPLTFEISDFDGSEGSDVKFGEMVAGRLDGSGTLDRSDAVKRGYSANVFFGYSSYPEAWVDVRVVALVGSFEGSDADKRSIMKIEGMK